MVYCPALDNENFRGRGIMATRSVQWHPRLYPERNLDTRKSMRVDGTDSVLCPSGTNKRIPVSSLVKSIELSRSEIGAFDARLNVEIQEDVATYTDVAFSRYQVGFHDADERTVTTRGTQTDGADKLPVSSEVQTSAMDDDVPNHPTGIGDSFSGQRQFELRSTQHRSAQTQGHKGGQSVALMNASDARRLVSKALGSDDVVFQWDPNHEKTGVSGIRFNYYRDRVKCTADYSASEK